MAKEEAKAKKKPADSKEEIEAKADKARRAKVDADNKKKAKEAAEKEAKLAKTPLNDEERAFLAKMAPKMNEGRAIMQPSPAQMLRYSQLVKRKGVK